MTEVKVEGSGPQALIRRWWWLIVLLLLALGFLCVAIGPGQFLLTPAPEPTETATDTPPNDVPTETAGATEEGGDSPTDEPTDEPTEEATPTEESTEEPTATVEVTEQYFCGLNPNDGVCCIGVENTDLDTAACKCDGDGTCEITEGFNCGDCQGGSCGSACTKNADCKNPYLTCSDGKCDGDLCPGPAPTKCAITDCQQQVTWPSYQQTDCKISCPGGGSWVDKDCNVAGPTCG